MSNLTAPQAHSIADQANANKYSQYLATLHTQLATSASRGDYEYATTVPSVYTDKVLEMLHYFNMFGYKVSIQRRVVTISW